MALQQIRLSQIKADLNGFMDFEQQLIAIFGDSYVRKYIAYADQIVFDLDKEYATGKHALRVFVNGVIQYEGEPNGWEEINNNTIRFLQPLKANDIVVIVYNTLPWYSNEMARYRISSIFNIFRNNNFITDTNLDQIIFDAPVSYVQGINQLSVYANGIHLMNGASFDYVELSDNKIRMNRTYRKGTNIMWEVMVGGMDVFTRDIYSYIITSQNLNQTEFLLPKSYVPGTNTVKVYRNGVLLRKGAENDYVETDIQTITLNYTVPINNVITFEIITFNLEVLRIVREYRIINASNQSDIIFETPPYIMGEKMLRVYLNGIMLDEDVNVDYTELTPTSFRYNKSPLGIDNVIEYEVITF